LGAVLLVGAMVSPLCAQSYPNKPIRFILPQSPGGVHDILGRIIGQRLAPLLGQPVVPENRPGAGSNIGTEYVAKAKPDGYTILLAAPGLSISPSIYRKLNYDPIKDLSPIALTAEVPVAVLVHPSKPFTNLKALIEYARPTPENSISVRAA
jgi:tripartite-type tricarboxylate transporter receptor subunit TctC